MKAHKLKLRLTSREEMAERFNSELVERIDKVASEKTKGGGILARFNFLQENSEKIRVEEKLKLLGEWERKGLPTRFNYFGK